MDPVRLWPALHNRIERLVDKMSEQVIDDYVKRELTENIDKDNRSHPQKYAKNSSISTKDEKCLIAPCAINLTPRVSIGGLDARCQQSA